jgi:hypothetical protein
MVEALRLRALAKRLRAEADLAAMEVANSRVGVPSRLNALGCRTNEFGVAVEVANSRGYVRFQSKVLLCRTKSFGCINSGCGLRPTWPPWRSPTHGYGCASPL